MAKWSDIKKSCPTFVHCTAAQGEEEVTASKYGTASTVSFIAGGALIATGTLLVLLNPKPKSSTNVRLRFGPSVSARGGALEANGTF
jgi:hypothetical protein